MHELPLRLAYTLHPTQQSSIRYLLRMSLQRQMDNSPSNGRGSSLAFWQPYRNLLLAQNLDCLYWCLSMPSMSLSQVFSYMASSLSFPHHHQLIFEWSSLALQVWVFDTLPPASVYLLSMYCSSGHHLSDKAAFPSILTLLGTLLGTAESLLVIGRNLLAIEGIRLLETTKWTWDSHGLIRIAYYWLCPEVL